MIEANNPEINVDELMNKIREEVANRHGQSQSTGITSNAEKAKMTTTISHIEALLKNAESRAYIRTKWPDKLNRFPFNLTKKLQKLALKIINFLFKDQREVNLNLLQSLRQSVALNRQLIEEVTTLRAQMDERLSDVDSRAQAINECLSDVDSRAQAINERLSDVDSRAQTMDDNFNTIDTWISSWMTSIQEHLDDVNSQVQGIDKRLNAVDELLGTKVTQSLPEILEVTEESYINSAIALSKIPIEEHYQHDKKDLFYYLFENVFYNSEVVKEKQKFYLNFINRNIKESYHFLDAGCGRGEFLQNLTAHEIKCVGIDLNKLEICTLKNSGFNAYESDIVDYLEKTDEKFSGISALQVVEHLNIEYINIFLSLSFEKIVVDGVIIIETVNPHSLYGLSNFYQDSTHVKPLPPELLKFLLEWHGFKSVKIIYSSLIPKSARMFKDKRMNYQDYAVIGYKKL
ncbi:MAG: methyltransferase domain-containing protein [Hassallia sp. WJT32-NPBG1]|jgi:O-antigen chain-terminating methyltransferase|nr:methyltransferase domain-containing protein [Hassallia sp. WJT32-NPBG1]